MRAGSDHLGTQLFFAFVCCKLKFYFRSTYLKSQNLIWDRNVSYLRPMTMTSMFEWSWLQYFIHLVSWTIKTFTWGFKSRLTYSLATQSFVCYSGTINSLLHLYYSNYHLRASVGVMYLDNPQNAVFSKLYAIIFIIICMTKILIAYCMGCAYNVAIVISHWAATFIVFITCSTKSEHAHETKAFIKFSNHPVDRSPLKCLLAPWAQKRVGQEKMWLYYHTNMSIFDLKLFVI